MGSETEGEFGRLIGLNLSLLRICGVIRRGEKSRGIERDVLAGVAVGCLSVYTISYVYEFVIRAAYSSTALESLAIMLSIVGGEARFLILLSFRGRCQRMLNVCELLWSPLTSEGKRAVRSYARKAKLLTRCYLSSCSCTIFFYAVAVVIAAAAASASEKNAAAEGNGTAGLLSPPAEQQRRLPYAFPVEIRESPFYEIAYVLQLLAMAEVALACAAVDMSGPLFALIACGHFRAIRLGIEGLAGSNEQRSFSPRSKVAIVENLRDCLDRHRTLLDFCEQLERLCSLIFLIQLMTSTYNISLVGFKLAGDDPDKYKYVTQLTIAVIQLFLCNWPADILATKSEAIGRAIYFSPWHRYPSRLRGPTSMVLARARRPVRLTAGKFVVLSLETFASMISSAASFFTVVRSMN